VTLGPNHGLISTAAGTSIVTVVNGEKSHSVAAEEQPPRSSVANGGLVLLPLFRIVRQPDNNNRPRNTSLQQNKDKCKIELPRF
jgi:hypothetical protein